MAKEIRWSPESIERFEQVIEYLSKNWSEREVENLVVSQFENFGNILIYPVSPKPLKGL